MAEEKDIKHFTATDIEKYWSGKLTPAEMHAMEKAALDDPFLADALEGYENINTATSDIASLKERLARRVDDETVVIPLKRKRITWLRVAAAIIIIVGVGLFLQQMVFKNNPAPAIATLEKSKKEQSAPASAPTGQVKHDTLSNKLSIITDTQAGTEIFPKTNKTLKAETTQLNSIKPNSGTPTVTESSKEKSDLVVSNAAPAAVNDAKREELEKTAYKRSVTDTSLYANGDVSLQAKPRAFSENKSAVNGLISANKFNYRVVDAQNNPVPFANVMNTKDNVGTYTDIQGNFNLLSGDSTMNVQIKSLGYNSAYYNLSPKKLTGDLVLKEDDETRKQILAQNRKVVSSLSRKDSTELEEPEVGWGFYNTYVANNIKIPENIRSKNTANEVELSFDIDKTGQPVNIKVTRSSQCKECDEEAIRVLRDGPKWKRKGKKSKGKVAIAVDPK